MKTNACNAIPMIKYLYLFIYTYAKALVITQPIIMIGV